MNIALIGYGKMGRAIHIIASQRGHNITIIDPVASEAQYKEISQESIANVDVCIDFTTPTSVIENARKISQQGKNLVIGTTGWYEKTNDMKEITKDIGCIWSGNFSIGMNVFFRAIANTAKIMNNLPEYDAAVYEVHHNQKKDSPGGSAQIIGKIILENMNRKNTMVADRFTERKPEPNELHVASIRCGSIPGTHTVLFDSQVDTIELKHTARGREGFALGAVMAAEFIYGKKGFFGIEDLMNTIIEVKK